MADEKPNSDHIRNPIEWTVDQVAAMGSGMRETSHRLHGDTATGTRQIEVRRIAVSDLRDVLARGVQDIGTYRTDVIFL